MPPQAAAQTGADRLATARRLELNGEWEAAAAVYETLLADPGATGQSARLDLARVSERLERFSAAVDLLRLLTETGDCRLPAGACARAWFQLGSVLQSLGRDVESVDAYRRSIELGSAAAAYARVESAKMLLASGETDAALAWLAPLLAGEGPENARRIALRLGARALEERGPGAEAEALTYYRAHAALALTADERVPSLWKTGALARGLGNDAAAAEAFRAIVQRYPGNREAEDALEALAQLGRPAPVLEAALVHYRRRNNATARDLYNEALRSGAPADRAVALFYLGALAERREEPRLAIENYSQSFDADPSGRLADEALWYRAVLYEGEGDTAAAQADYTLIVERNSGSPRTAEAVFRNGYISYEAGQLQEARRRWTASIQAPRNGVAATAAFWAGRAAAELGDQAGAQAAYAEAVRRDPHGYYGLRAAAVLAGQPQAPRTGSFTLRLPADDWAAVESWLAGWAGGEDAGVWAAFQATEDWRASWELTEAGWSKIALDAFLRLLDRHGDQPWIQYRAGRALAEGGFPRAGYLAGYYLATNAPDGPLPAAVMRLRYPAPWPEVVQRYADQRGIDPLLFYAMMRQESAFDPAAGSSAGAFGLTQVIAPTAMEIAEALGKSGVRFTDLARPVLAIEFGAYYLAAQVRQFGGNVYQGLAAYNGGGGSASRWRREAGNPADVDRFQEEIDFPETETYVRTVIENYAWYRFLYSAADRPSIVR